ncbi:MAG: hypothetical protein Q4A64_01515 [Porphyromonadaceae bacterium]|nr:hypothetical protein [Porphyromonadaceae bacterium]
MKKLFLIGAMLLGLSAQAQNDTFSQGTKVVSAGVGFGTYGVGSMVIPPLAASFEYSIKDNFFDDKSSIGVGGYVGYYGLDYKTTILNVNQGYKTSHIVLGGRGALHYQFVDKLDTYVGLMLGYRVTSATYYGYSGPLAIDASNTNSGLAWDSFIGARYYFTDRLAANLELGYGNVAAHIGVSYKL